MLRLFARLIMARAVVVSHLAASKLSKYAIKLSFSLCLTLALLGEFEFALKAKSPCQPCSML
ncbi:hypothetical protein CUP0973 [Campylobacter upsaliensis RM3195]|nr:hypothetical protein CUP0973 [Campylobacter upsaliensis RM3195]